MKQLSLRALSRDWQFWVGMAVSLFFLYWAVRQASDVRNVGEALTKANYLYLAPALAVYFAGVAIRSVRWRYLLHPVADIPTRRLFPVVVIGYMANDILPARMGELVRAYVLGRDEGVSKSAALATIFVERVFDGLTMLVFIVAVAAFVPLDSLIAGIVRIAGPLMLGLLVVALVLASSPPRALALADKLLPLAPANARPKLAGLIERFLTGLRVLQSSRAMLAVFGLSIAAWLCEATMYYLIGAGFGLAVGIPAYLTTTAIANLGTMVPSSPGYVGTFEALGVFSLSRFGVSGDLALSYTVALHAALLVPITLLGFYYMWRRHVTLRLAEPAGPPA